MNVLAYWSNSNNKSNEIYVVKYIKSLEQSISQAIIFRGRLGNCFSNIVRFLLPLWTLSMWLILTNGLIVEMWGEAWNVLVQLGSPWSPVIATRRAHPGNPPGPGEWETHEQTEPNPWSRIDHSLTSMISSQTIGMTEKSDWFACHFIGSSLL